MRRATEDGQRVLLSGELHDRRNRDAAFGGVGLPEAKRCGAHFRPARPVPDVRTWSTQIFEAVVDWTTATGVVSYERIALASLGAVVRLKQNEGVVVFADTFEVVQEPTHVCVQVLDH